MHKLERIISRRITIALSLLILTCSATKAQDVKYNFMPGTGFSKYHSYKWVNIEGAAHPNQIIDQEIRQAIDTQLASKGLLETDSEKADLYVGYQVAVDQEKQWNAWGVGRGFGGGMGSATSTTISIGSLVLDMYDPTTKQLVWTGNVTKALDPSSNQEKLFGLGHKNCFLDDTDWRVGFSFSTRRPAVADSADRPETHL